MPLSEEFLLHDAEITSWTQWTAWLVQCWSSSRTDLPGLSLSRLKVYVAAIAAYLAVSSQSTVCLCPQSYPVAKVWSTVSLLWVLRRGSPATKQGISKWILEAISLAIGGVWTTFTYGCQSTCKDKYGGFKRLRGVLYWMYHAKCWSSPYTFVRFYNLDLDSTPAYALDLFSPWFTLGQALLSMA